MSAAREAILARIRGALRDVPAAERAAEVPVARDYRAAGELRGEALVARFAERVSDYAADVGRVAAGDVADAVTRGCADMGLRKVAVPPALAQEWHPRDVELLRDDGLAPADLDAIDGVVTGCATGIAETGTVVLDGGPVSGRRLLTLVPDHHICIIRAEQIVELVPEAIAAVAPAVRERRAPITLVSGPSASSDIELSRVEGVHGPRHLLVLIVDPA
ncbi:MAG: lactate utilization protein C [Solirubrobacteraceae bacterium]